MRAENGLIEQRIIQLEKELKQASEDLHGCKKEKEEFIFNASHDLKAPLRKLTTFTERLIRVAGQDLNEDALSCIDRIRKNVISMQSLIDDLSKLSEIEAKDFEKCHLSDILNAVLEESSVPWKIESAAIHIADLPVIYGNTSQLKLAFKSIIDNAIKFQPEGQRPEISISADLLKEEEKIKYHLPAENAYCAIQFADNGIGFNIKEAAQIFKPFVRLNGKSSYAGNGIGLAICDKIIKLHKGIVYAQPIQDKGSVFVVILPEFLH